MAAFGFGTKIGFLENPEIRYILDILHMHELKLGVYEQWPDLSRLGLGKLISRITPKVSKTAQRFNAWYQAFTENTITNNRDSRKGIFGPVVEGYDVEKPESGHTKAQMLAEGSFTLFTASEGNAITFSAIQYYITNDIRVYEALLAEVRGRFKPGQSISWGLELTSCEYLRACIDETLRMLPPASSVHWRECERDDVAMNGEIIPIGCDVGISLHALFRRTDIFRDANTFWPERWIKGVLPEQELTRARRTFKPFSIGPRSCAGQTVAMMILSISLANLVNQYHFRLAQESHSNMVGSQLTDRLNNGQKSELQYESHFTASWKEGPYVQFRRRMA